MCLLCVYAFFMCKIDYNITSLLLFICVVLIAADACSSNPCLKGKCSNRNGGLSYNCSCNLGFTGSNCQTGKSVNNKKQNSIMCACM